jgi:hypothetical protein
MVRGTDFLHEAGGHGSLALPTCPRFASTFEILLVQLPGFQWLPKSRKSTRCPFIRIYHCERKYVQYIHIYIIIYIIIYNVVKPIINHPHFTRWVVQSLQNWRSMIFMALGESNINNINIHGSSHQSKKLDLVGGLKHLDHFSIQLRMS